MADRGILQGRGGDCERIRHGRLLGSREDLRHGAGAHPVRGEGPARLPEFYDRFASHDAKGAAKTLRGYQINRPSIYDFEADIKKIALPTLIICGDEDDPCIEPSDYLKKHIAASGLAMFPKSGHTVNIEEPALFNQTLADFLALVDAGRWGARDKRSIRERRNDLG